MRLLTAYRNERLRALAELKVLFVEEDEMVRAALSALLGGTVQLHCVATGLEAIEELARNQYSVLVSDINLADMSGLVLCHHVRAYQPSCEPIILVFGDTDDEAAEVFARRHRLRCFRKPYAMTELLELIEDVACGVAA